MKRQAAVWEKIFANYVSDKGFIFGIDNGLSNSIVKNKQSNQKTDKRHKQIFHQRNFSDGNKHMTKCSVSLASREVQTKTLMAHQYTPIRTAKREGVTKANAGEEMEKPGCSYIAGRNAKWYSHSKTVI